MSDRSVRLIELAAKIDKRGRADRNLDAEIEIVLGRALLSAGAIMDAMRGMVSVAGNPFWQPAPRHTGDLTTAAKLFGDRIPARISSKPWRVASAALRARAARERKR